MMNVTGCHGVSTGRGAFYNPWIFKHTDHYLQTGDYYLSRSLPSGCG